MLSSLAYGTSLKVDYDYDLCHLSRGGVAKIFIVVHDTSRTVLCSAFYFLCASARAWPLWYFDSSSGSFVTFFQVQLRLVKNIQVISQVICGCKIIIVIEQIYIRSTY